MFAGPNGSGKSTLKSCLPEALLGQTYANIRRIRVVGSYYRTDVGRSLWPPGTE
jgi:ABC-type multidrug transport system ATPase subunit